MSNEEYTHQEFWKQRFWIEKQLDIAMSKFYQDAETQWASEHDAMMAQKNNHLFWFDPHGRKIIGKSPDRTCTICWTGFGLETMGEDQVSPCCNTHHHVAALWE